MDSRDERDGRIREPLQDERGSTVARVIAIAALVAAVALAALAMFGGGSSYTVHAVFQNAGQLVKGNQVRVGGSPVGTITDINLDDQANAVVTMKVDGSFAPLHQGTTATIRTTSLSGIANRYVSLAPGPNNADKISDGGRITVDETRAPVDLDVLFNTLDPKTREGLKNLIRGSGTWYASRGKQGAEAAKYFPAFLSSTSDLTSELALDEQVFQRFVKDTSTTVTALAERRDDLAGLVTNTNTAFKAIGDENASLDRALAILPDTLRKANTTFVNLRSTVDDLQNLVDESKPATKDLAPFLRQLRPLVHEAKPTVADLSRLIRSPGPNNDLIDLTAKQPHLAELTASIFPRAIKTLDRAQPVFSYVRGYTPDFASWLSNFGQVAANYDANGHYARVQPMFLPANYSAGTLTAVTPAGKLNGFEKNIKNRCPGGVVQPSPDGSTPFAFGGCNTASSP